MNVLITVLICVALIGCATVPRQPNTVYDTSWSYKTYYQYEVEIISDPPGAKIEWNNDYIGTTPVRRILNGDVGLLASTTIKAYPVTPGQCVQTKYIPGDQIFPHTIYFDMSLRPIQPSINVNIGDE